MGANANGSSSRRCRKGNKPNYVSKYRAMWTFALFDLPVKALAEKKEYVRFRKALLALGFTMLQYSVYARYAPTKESAESLLAKVQRLLPPDGEVRVLAVTDTQFGKMRVFMGKKRKKTEKPPDQLLLF